MNGPLIFPIVVIGRVTWILNIACASVLAVFSWTGTSWNSSPFLHWYCIIPMLCIHSGGPCGMLLRSCCSYSSCLAYYKNFFVGELLSATVVWHVAVIELFKLPLVRFLHAAEKGVVEFQCYEPKMGQCGCRVLVPLSSFAYRTIHYCGFSSIFVGCKGNSALLISFIVTQQKSICRVLVVSTTCFHPTLPDGLYRTGLKPFFHHRRETKGGALGANIMYASPSVVHVEPTDEPCSVLRAVIYLCPTFQVQLETVDPLPASSSISNFYDANLNAEGEWNLSDMPLSRGIDVHSRSQAYFALVRDKCVA